jgi:hypothetical protein
MKTALMDTTPLDVASIVELHVLTDVETAFGFYWRRCSCSAISPGFTYEESAEHWVCPHEEATAEIAAYAERVQARARRLIAAALEEWNSAQQGERRI